MKNVFIDPYSACACPLTMICNGHTLGSATGFFWKRNGSIYLVSNWHVFSGRNPVSGRSTNIDGAVPDTIRVLGSSAQNPNDNFELQIPLTKSDMTSAWLQSGIYGQKADVAVYNLSLVLKEMKVGDNIFKSFPCINELHQTTDMFCGVGLDVFVLGFPLGIMKTGILPIWKRASVATEYDFDVNDIPSFLIDTATREGMSGAPVIQRANSGYKTKNGSFSLGAVANNVLGIYSGRYIGELDEAQLGIVWKSELIDKIIDDPIPGDFVLT